MVDLKKASPKEIRDELTLRAEEQRLNNITWEIANILRLRKEDKIEEIYKTRFPAKGQSPENRRDVIVVQIKHWVQDA